MKESVVNMEFYVLYIWKCFKLPVIYISGITGVPVHVRALFHTQNYINQRYSGVGKG